MGLSFDLLEDFDDVWRISSSLTLNLVRCELGLSHENRQI